MFWVAAVVQELILPPGIFIVLGIVVVILIAARKSRVAMWIGLVAVVAALALSLEPVATGLLAPLENRYAPLPPLAAADDATDTDARDADAEEADDGEQPTDAADAVARRIDAASHIVVLGGGTVLGSPETRQGTLKPDAMKRAVYGHQLHMAYGLPVVLTGGTPAGYPDEPPEAQVAADLLLSLGSTQEQLRLETESRDTWENARYVDALICNETVVLVTSAYHMARAVRSFAAHGFTVVPAPTDYKAKRGGYSFLSFLPSIESLRESTTALHEYLGFLYYRFRTPDPEDAVAR